MNNMNDFNSEKQEIRDTGFQKLEALKSAGNQISLELFLECLTHPYQWIRIEAVSIVGNYRNEDFTLIFGMALNDRCSSVVGESAQALAKINSEKALEILSNIFFEDVIERLDHIANAISAFGEKGNDVFLKGIRSISPNIRYYSAKFIDSRGNESINQILAEMALNDNEKTTFGGLVSTTARRRLKVLTRQKTERSDSD